MNELVALINQLRSVIDTVHDQYRAANNILQGLADPGPNTGPFDPNTSTDPDIQALVQQQNLIRNRIREVRSLHSRALAFLRIRGLEDVSLVAGGLLSTNLRYVYNSIAPLQLPLPGQSVTPVATVQLPNTANQDDLIAFMANDININSTIEVTGPNGINLTREFGEGFAFLYVNDTWELIPNSFDLIFRPQIVNNRNGIAYIGQDSIQQFMTIRPGELSEWPVSWPDSMNIESAIVSDVPRSAVSARTVVLPTRSRVSLVPDLNVEEEFDIGNVVSAGLTYTSEQASTDNSTNPAGRLVVVTENSGLRSIRYFTFGTSGVLFERSSTNGQNFVTAEDLVDVFVPDRNTDAFEPLFLALRSGEVAGGKVPSQLLQYDVQVSPQFGGAQSAVNVTESTVTTTSENVGGVEFGAISAFGTTDFRSAAIVTPNPSRYSQAVSGNDSIDLYSVALTSMGAPVATIGNNLDISGSTSFTDGTETYFFCTQENSTEIVVIRAFRDLSNGPSEIGFETTNIDFNPGGTGGLTNPVAISGKNNLYLVSRTNDANLATAMVRVTIGDDLSDMTFTPITVASRTLDEPNVDSITAYNSAGFSYLIYSSVLNGITIKRTDFFGDELTLRQTETVFLPYTEFTVPVGVGALTYLFAPNNQLNPLPGTIDVRNGESSFLSVIETEEPVDVMVTGSNQT